MCVQRALPRNGNLLVGSPYRISCTVQNIISLSSVLVHAEQLCACFIETHGHLPVPSAAVIGKTFRTSKETLHAWKRSNNSSPPTNFFLHVARQNCLPAPSSSSTPVWSKKGKYVLLSPTQLPRRFQRGDRTRWRLHLGISFTPFGSLICRLVMWWPMKVPCPGARSSGSPFSAQSRPVRMSP